MLYPDKQNTHQRISRLPDTALNRLLIVALTITVLGSFSILSSYFYVLETSGSFNLGRVLLQRVPSYLLWVALTPVLSTFVNRLNTKNRNRRDILFLCLSLLLISAAHRITALFAGNILLGTTTPAEFFSDLIKQKFLFLSLWFDSAVTCCVIFSVLYSIALLHRERTAELERIHAQELLLEAKTRNLNNAFQPHFLFNALHGISSVMYQNIATADTMLMKIGNILRYSIVNGNKTIHTLNDEITIAKEYADIQQLRFGKRLNFILNISDADTSFPVPVFLLQPLLENAVKHAVEKSSDSTSVVMNITTDKNIFRLSAENALYAQQTERTNGSGLQLLQERLSLLYGNDAHFSVTSDDSLFRIDISFPLITADYEKS